MEWFSPIFNWYETVELMPYWFQFYTILITQKNFFEELEEQYIFFFIQ